MWAQPDAKPFGKETVFGSGVWNYQDDRGQIDAAGPGELRGPRRRVKAQLSPFRGQAVDGNENWYVSGIPIAEMQSPPPDGLCGGPGRNGVIIGANAIQGYPGVQAGIAGMLIGIIGVQNAGAYNLGSGGAVEGVQGLAFAGVVSRGDVGVVTGAQGIQNAPTYQIGSAGIRYGESAFQPSGVNQSGSAGILTGVLGVQYEGPFQVGAAGVRFGSAAAQTAGVTQIGVIGVTDGSVGDQMIPPVLFQIEQQTSQNIPPSTVTAIIWDTVVLDAHSQWGGSSHKTRVNLPWAGDYLINFQAITGPSAPTLAGYLYANGTYVTGTRLGVAPTVAGSGVSWNWVYNATAGDYVEFEIRQDAAATYHLEYTFGADTYPHLQVVYLGPNN